MGRTHLHIYIYINQIDPKIKYQRKKIKKPLIKRNSIKRKRYLQEGEIVVMRKKEMKTKSKPIGLPSMNKQKWVHFQNPKIKS